MLNKQTEKEFEDTFELLNSYAENCKERWGFLDVANSSPLVWVDYKGTRMTSNQVNDQAIAAKRAGNYGEANEAYTAVFKAYMKYVGQIPVACLRGYLKVLVSANYFYVAYQLTMEALIRFSKCRSEADPDESKAFLNYLNQFVQLSTYVVKNQQFALITGLAASHSGMSESSYQLQRTIPEILKEISLIYEETSEYLSKQ